MGGEHDRGRTVMVFATLLYLFCLRRVTEIRTLDKTFDE